MVLTNRARIGCLSGSGILAVILTLALVSGVGLARGGLLFSPGELNAQPGTLRLGGVNSHAETGGRCSACHPAFWEKERMDDRCVTCHNDQLNKAQDFHAVMVAQGTELTCRRCHTDHRGVQASMTRLELENFPHDLLTYSLRAHQQMPDSSSFTCSDCHADDFSRFNLTTCETCHLHLSAESMATHMRDFGQDCLACHDGLDSYGESFDHNQLAFVLEGGHTGVACRDCHTQARRREDLQSTTQDCIDCHARDDAHNGRFGRDCKQCHTPESWQEATYDHSLAAFPLTGAHLEVECGQCHQNWVFQGTPSACLACHAEPDYHRGLFEGDCATCHSAEGWSPARYDRSHTFPIDHGESGWSACSVCHPDSLSTYTCYGCHEHNPGDVEVEHREEGISNFQDCVRCHPNGLKEEGEGGGDDD